MRAVVQRVKNACVKVDEEVVGSIEKGVLVFLGVEKNDSENDAEWMVEKIINLRIFEDENDKMNLSLIDIDGELLAVSQFTLLGDSRKGRRPSFTEAAPPEKAQELYRLFIKKAEEKVPTETGIFQTYMSVSITNDGPVTILLDSKKTF
ncbi:MAG: D-aminoacyl-tRNA deacylase [Thermotogota bacterium]|nr:D-aminoacyl-tRNA deacylase [Thermotogota bacterium]